MECRILNTALQPFVARIDAKRIETFQINLAGLSGKGLHELNRVLTGRNPVRHERWRLFCDPFSLEKEFMTLQSKNLSNEEASDPDNSPLDAPEGLPTSDQLKALLVNSERSNLIKKLGEANQHNRFLKRQLKGKEDELLNFQSELIIIEHEIQELVSLAKEIANYSIPSGSRKINGKYIQSHLLSRIQAVHEKLEDQIKDVDAAQLKEVELVWHGMAESVQVMGSFDGWTQGEHLSPEYSGSYTTFTTKMMLKRGRYEIKFLVDGEWHLSPEFPTVGEGLMQNNLLVVD